MQSFRFTTSRFASKPASSPLAFTRTFLHHRHASPAAASVFNPLRIPSNPSQRLALVIDNTKNKKRPSTGVCRASITFHPRTLQWISVVSTAILMLTKHTAINKSYLVPLFALQAPASVINWMQGEYGVWSAFLALLVRLFFFLPAELELPFMTLLLVIIAPYQAINFRGTQPGNIISLALAAYLAFQHFSPQGGFKKAFTQGGIIPSSAIILITTLVAIFLFI